ncbi:MAG: diaminopimelate decarboxylase, partial [Gemmatimonadota bacterium]
MGSLLLNDEMASFGSEPAFPRRGGVLYAEQVPLPAIAAAVGTPTYVYSANTIRARWQRLDQAFASVPHRIHFAMKANSNLGV